MGLLSHLYHGAGLLVRDGLELANTFWMPYLLSTRPTTDHSICIQSPSRCIWTLHRPLAYDDGHLCALLWLLSLVLQTNSVFSRRRKVPCVVGAVRWGGESTKSIHTNSWLHIWDNRLIAPTAKTSSGKLAYVQYLYHISFLHIQCSYAYRLTLILPHQTSLLTASPSSSTICGPR